jgi:hypothetical protein
MTTETEETNEFLTCAGNLNKMRPTETIDND